MPWIEWYDSLAKPAWTPAPATIGLIWQILYPVILVSSGFVFVQAFRKKLPWRVALPFAVNLVANLIFTPVQFGMGTCRWRRWIFWSCGPRSPGWWLPSGGTTAGSPWLKCRISCGCRWRPCCNCRSRR